MKYLATDLDGTLLNPRLKYSYVCSANKKALKNFNQRVIIISGRNQPFVKNVCKELKIKETFIACNGASIYLNGKEFVSLRLNKQIVLFIIEYVKSHFKDYKILLFDSFGRLYSLSNDNTLSIQVEQDFKKRLPKTAYITNKNINTINRLINKENEVTKLNITMNEKDKKALYEILLKKYPKLAYSLCESSLEVTPPTATKGEALIKLAKIMNLKPDDIFVIGDDNNDASMFDCFHYSFLVKSNRNEHLNNKVLHVLDHFKDIVNYIKED